ncbi:ABC transporter permease [Oceanobacillus sp. CFH 90083]|uniref:ABC transporter permease n=1 Tax=Oceanobacillus sp. CFH 90083 TaxID=2592336 RepID=UPI001D1527AF|nr:ABC transporter permease [Oceanobacillus sp. CFH 90083]
MQLLRSRSSLLAILLVIIIVIMSMLNPSFLSINNLLGVTQFGAVLALIAIGQSLVIISGNGGIDLSVGSMVSLSGVFIGLAMSAGLNIWIAAFIGILGGLLLGMINAFVISIVNMPPFIATLGAMYLYGSLALVLTGGNPISGFPQEFSFIGQGLVAGIPSQIILIVIPVFLLICFLVYKTTFGRSIYLIGSNQTAARYANINVKKTRFIVFSLSGLMAGIASIIMTSWLMTARADAGFGMELEAITVAVLGGIHIFGGLGHLGGVMMAVLTITILSSGLQMANVNSIWQLAILGFVLIGAVFLNQFLNKDNSKK